MLHRCPRSRGPYGHYFIMVTDNNFAASLHKTEPWRVPLILGKPNGQQLFPYGLRQARSAAFRWVRHVIEPPPGAIIHDVYRVAGRDKPISRRRFERKEQTGD